MNTKTRDKYWKRIKHKFGQYCTKEVEECEQIYKSKHKHPLLLELERLSRARERGEISLWSALLDFRQAVVTSWGREITDDELLCFLKKLKK